MSETPTTAATLTPAEARNLYSDIASANCNIQIACNLWDIKDTSGKIREYLGFAMEQTEKASELVWRIEHRDAPPTLPANLSDLSDLAALDTENGRELLELLTRALSVAEKVDTERGNVVAGDVPLLPGESRGTDYAESLSTLILRLRTEVHGPQTGRE